MKYQAIYKCRLCGGTYQKHTYYPYELTDDMRITHLIVDKHKCKDGNKGLADFQGFKAVEE